MRSEVRLMWIGLIVSLVMFIWQPYKTDGTWFLYAEEGLQNRPWFLRYDNIFSWGTKTGFDFFRLAAQFLLLWSAIVGRITYRIADGTPE